MTDAEKIKLIVDFIVNNASEYKYLSMHEWQELLTPLGCSLAWVKDFVYQYRDTFSIFGIRYNMDYRAITYNGKEV